MSKQLELFSDFYKPQPQLRNGPWQWLYRFFFGDDIFISYSRADAGRYATSLAVKMSDLGYLCFLDQLGTDPDRNLPASLKKKIGMSTAMVLIGTHSAVSSKYIHQEVDIFKSTKRAIHPLNVGGALSFEDWPELAGLNQINESRASLDKGEPSADTITQLTNASRYRRRSQWLRLLIKATAGLVAVVLLSTALWVWVASINAKYASSVAEMDVAVSRKETATALASELRATRGQRSAEVETQIATAEARKAVELRRDAEDAKIQAQELERRAKRNAAIAMQQEEGARAALLSREPGREFDALNHALHAADSASKIRSLTPEQVERGLVSSVSAIDYSVPLNTDPDTVPGHVNFTQMSPDGSKMVGRIVDPMSLRIRWAIWSIPSGSVTVLPAEIQLASKGRIMSASFSRDGRRLALVENGSVLLWDLTGANPVRLTPQCRSVRSPMRGAALNNDGSELLMVFSSQAKLCSVSAGSERDLLPMASVNTQTPHFNFYDGAFTVTNEPALAGTWEEPVAKRSTSIVYFPGTQKRIDLKSAEERLVGFDERNSVITIKRHAPSQIHIQNVENEVQTLGGYKGQISSVAIVNQRVAVVTSTKRELRLVGTRTYPTFAALRAHDNTVRAVTFSPDGRFAATVGSDDTARVWDGASGELLHTVRMQLALQPVPGSAGNEQRPSMLDYVVFSPDSTRLVTVSDQGQIQTWDVRTGRAMCPGSQPPGGTYDGEGSVIAVSFVEGTENLVVAQSGGLGTVTFWNASTCRFVKRLFTNTSSLSFAVFSKRGTQMLTIGNVTSDFRSFGSPVSRDVKLWDVGSANLNDDAILRPTDLGTVTGNQSLQGIMNHELLTQANTRGQKTVVLATGTPGRPLTIWQPEKDPPFHFRSTWELKDATDFDFATVSADGNRVAAIVGRQIIVWETQTGKRLIAIDCDPEDSFDGKRPLALSADGSRLIVASKDHTARIYPTTFDGFLQLGRQLAARD